MWYMTSQTIGTVSKFHWSKGSILLRCWFDIRRGTRTRQSSIPVLMCQHYCCLDASRVAGIEQDCRIGEVEKRSSCFWKLEAHKSVTWWMCSSPAAWWTPVHGTGISQRPTLLLSTSRKALSLLCLTGFSPDLSLFRIFVCIIHWIYFIYCLQCIVIKPQPKHLCSCGTISLPHGNVEHCIHFRLKAWS